MTGMSDIDCSRQEYVRDYVNERNMYVWGEAFGRVSNQYTRDGSQGDFHLIKPEEQGIKINNECS